MKAIQLLSISLTMLISSGCTYNFYEGRQKQYSNSTEIKAAMRKDEIAVYENNSSYCVDIANGRMKEMNCFIFKKKTTERKVAGYDLEKFSIENADRTRLNEIADKTPLLEEYILGLRPDDAKRLEWDWVKNCREDGKILIMDSKGTTAILWVGNERDDAPWIARSHIACFATKPLYVVVACGDIVVIPVFLIIGYPLMALSGRH